MTARIKIILLIAITTCGSLYANAQASESLYLQIFEDLASTVCESDAEVSSETAIATGALSFLTNAYSEHDYHESGCWGGNFELPVKGSLTSSYGYRRKFKRFHHGIDVALNVGDSVKCSLPGVVTGVGFEAGGYGRYVVVSHSGGVETLYAPLSKILVIPGQKIESGEILGLGGTSGNATGPHLHFETRYQGVAIDPISWFNLSSSF